MTAYQRIAARSSAGDGFGPVAIAVLFFAFAAAACIPLFAHRLPPFADYANHLARMHVIAAVDGDSDLSRYYRIEWDIIPNLVMDLLVPLFDRVMGVYRAGQLFVALSFVLVLSGTFALNRALFERWSPVPLLATPFLFNGVLLVGVLNYVFGIGLALWALAAWIAFRDRSLPSRLAMSTAFVVALFFCHLFAVGVYAVGLLSLEACRLWQVRRIADRRYLLEFVAAGLPFAVVPVLLLLGPTVDTPGFPAYWEWWGKLHGIELAFALYYPAIGLAIGLVLFVVAAAAALTRVLRVHPAAWFVLAIGAVVYLGLPRAIFASHMADQRLPIALVFVLLACVQADLRSQVTRYVFVAIAVALAALRIGEVQFVWDQTSVRSEEFARSVRLIDRGARVFVMHDSKGPEKITNGELMHAASLATIERSALVSTNFTVPGKHILRAREPYSGIVDTENNWPPSLRYVLAVTERGDPAKPYFWDRWPEKYDFVYLLFTDRGQLSPDPRYLEPVFEGDGYHLYRVVKAGEADAEQAVSADGG